MTFLFDNNLPAPLAEALRLLGRGVTHVREIRELGQAAPDDLILDYAAQFAPPNKASRAVGRIKRAVQSGLEAGFGEGLAMEREMQQLLFESSDAKEGIAANLEKRKPEFKGK